MEFNETQFTVNLALPWNYLLKYFCKNPIIISIQKVNMYTETTISPLKVVGRRANKLMCIIQNLHKYQDVEWLEENDVDILKSHESEHTNWLKKLLT